VFVDAGHDVRTVRDERLQGRPDEVIYEVCRVERRCLVTLDLDFSNVLRFPPEPTSGIIVLRPNGGLTLGMLTALARQVVGMMSNQSVEGMLWIVEPGRTASISHHPKSSNIRNACYCRSVRIFR
jgi:predicted nuclease of predicted toxin-antitoxin system